MTSKVPIQAEFRGGGQPPIEGGIPLEQLGKILDPPGGFRGEKDDPAAMLET